MSYLISCFKRLLYSPAFYAAAVGTAVICMFSPIYDPKSGEFENILYVYTHCTKSELLTSTWSSSYSVFKEGLGGWLSMFSPVIAAIASVGIKSDERTSRVNRFFIQRTGRSKYNVGSCLFYLLSGGITVSLGYGLFAIAVYLGFPHISEYPAENAAFYMETAFEQGSIMEDLYKLGGEGLTVFAQLLEIFVYGIVCSAIPVAASVFTDNKYVIVCTPFFLKYAANYLSLLLTSWSYRDPWNPNEALAQIGSVINPDAVTTVLSYKNNLVQILLLNTVLVAAASLFFCICNQRKQNV